MEFANEQIRLMSHIPILTIPEFFKVYGLGQPLHPEIMCMRLEDQPDTKLMSMPLYRSGFFRVIQFTGSILTYTASEKRISVLNNCLSFSYPGKLESWERKGRLYGNVVYFTESFAQMNTQHSCFNNEFPFFTFEGDALVPLDKTEAKQLKSQAEEMIVEMYSERGDKISMTCKLLSVYLHKVRRLYGQKIGAQTPESKANQTLFNRFRKTADDYFQQLAERRQNTMPSVSMVAETLGVTANHLNESVKSVTGQTASAHLQRKMVLEIKSYLLHTDLQAAEIAFRVGFENVPYFNRFFKKHTRETPVEFRKHFKG